ncbi:MlaD family protein [Endozoicomonas sp. SESOKO1]|uniref:MlaD family protein n=1 Tax=Endozoicomonas sp. SESOKO1 TaxID=2828742 RepID=UPI002147CC3D|nr:MlaD family protein [Endozoicomonas sp. SESOKO1]
MNRKSLSVSVGLFVILILTMTIALVLFLNAGGFSRNDVQRYQILFDSSIKGLSVGAPVTLRGVKIGEVVSIKSKLYHNHQKVLNVVTIDLYPDTISEQGKGSGHNVLGQLIKQGLSAQIGLQSVLTGLLYIEVDLFDSAPEMQPVATEYPQIPTVPNNLEEFIERFESINIAEMASSLTEVLDNLARLTGDDRLNKLIDDVDQAFVSMEAMSNEMSADMAGIRSEFASMSQDAGEVTALLKAQLPAATQQLNATMLQLQETISVVEGTLAPDSPLVYQLTQSSKDISRASRAVVDLADMLQRQPDSIIFGRQSGDSR